MQTAYNYLPNRNVAGLIQGLNPTRILTFENPVDTMIFGQFAARYAGQDDGCKQPSASGDVILGVVMRDLAHQNVAALTVDGLLAQSAVPIIPDGDIWCQTEEALVVGDTPYIVYAGKAQVQTITLSTDLITGNIITTVVNGSSVSTTYATDHATTRDAHAVKIAALAGVATCTGTGDVFTVTANIDATLVITTTVAGGASVPTVVIAQTVAGLPTSNRGRLRNDADTSRALDASAYVKILEYDSVTTLARVRVAVHV